MFGPLWIGSKSQVRKDRTGQLRDLSATGPAGFSLTEKHELHQFSASAWPLWVQCLPSYLGKPRHLINSPTKLDSREWWKFPQRKSGCYYQQEVSRHCLGEKNPYNIAGYLVVVKAQGKGNLQALKEV